MRKLFLRGCWLIVVLLIVPFFASAARYRRLRITYRGNYKYVTVYIFNRNYGRLYRNNTLVVRRRAGRRYLIRLKKGYKQVRRRVYLSYNKDRRIVFRTPVYRTLAKRGVVTLVLDGRYQRAKLYVNGKRRGWVEQDDPRKLVLRTGREYLIQARRRGRIRTRHIYLGMTPKARRKRVVLLF